MELTEDIEKCLAYEMMKEMHKAFESLEAILVGGKNPVQKVLDEWDSKVKYEHKDLKAKVLYYGLIDGSVLSANEKQMGIATREMVFLGYAAFLSSSEEFSQKGLPQGLAKEIADKLKNMKRH